MLGIIAVCYRYCIHFVACIKEGICINTACCHYICHPATRVLLLGPTVSVLPRNMDAIGGMWPLPWNFHLSFEFSRYSVEGQGIP